MLIHQRRSPSRSNVREVILSCTLSWWFLLPGLIFKFLWLPSWNLVSLLWALLSLIRRWCSLGYCKLEIYDAMIIYVLGV
jgi:hypothetical protein